MTVQNGIILSGLGSKFAGRPLKDVYTNYPDTQSYEIVSGHTPNLQYGVPDPNSFQGSMEHWGPDFKLHVDGQPWYKDGTWHAHLRNPHLEEAVRSGRITTTRGANLETHPDGGVIYHGFTRHPGAQGYTSFGHMMAGDARNYLQDWLALSPDQRRPLRRTPTPGAKIAPGLPAAQRAPTRDAPYGYGGEGRPSSRYGSTWETDFKRESMVVPNHPELGYHDPVAVDAALANARTLATQAQQGGGGGGGGGGGSSWRSGLGTLRQVFRRGRGGTSQTTAAPTPGGTPGPAGTTNAPSPTGTAGTAGTAPVGSTAPAVADADLADEEIVGKLEPSDRDRAVTSAAADQDDDGDDLTTGAAARPATAAGGLNQASMGQTLTGQAPMDQAAYESWARMQYAWADRYLKSLQTLLGGFQKGALDAPMLRGKPLRPPVLRKLPRAFTNAPNGHTLESAIKVLQRHGHPTMQYDDPQLLREDILRAARMREEYAKLAGEAAVLEADDPDDPDEGEPQGSRELGPDDFAVPGKGLLPLYTARLARQSWDDLQTMQGLTPDERDEAEDRILDVLHVHGLPERWQPPADQDAHGPDGGTSRAPTQKETTMAAPQRSPSPFVQDVIDEATNEGETPEHEMFEKISGSEPHGPKAGADISADYSPSDHDGDDDEDEDDEEDEDYDDEDGDQDEDDEDYDDEDEDDQEAPALPPPTRGAPAPPLPPPPPPRRGMAAEPGLEGTGPVREAMLTAKGRSKVSKGQFACPRLRKLPINDAAHTRNAMARFNQTQGMTEAEKRTAWRKITRAAKKFGVAVSGSQKQNREDVREAAAVDIPSRIPVRFMTVGFGNHKDGHFYTEDAVRGLVPHIKGQPKMFISHSDMSEVQRHGHRPLEQLGAIAVRESVRYDPHLKAAVGEAILRPAMREFVEVAHAAGDTIGISVDAKGLFKPGSKECVGWSAFYSADFVPKGGAGGTTVPVREADRPDLAAADKEFMLMSVLDTLSATEVREASPTLYEAIGKEYADAHPITEVVREAQVDGPDVERLVRENEGLLSERDAALQRLDELEAERNREQVARFVDQLVRESGIEGAPQVSYVCKMFAGATCGPRGTFQTKDELEQAVRESAQDYLSTLPAAPPSGEITGLGGTTAPVKESGEWVNPFQVVSDGMAMLWGHSPEKSGTAPSA